MYFCSFSSDSSGNSYLIKNESTAILLDVGISCKKIEAGLKENSLTLSDVDGILLTHEHIDHVKSVGTVRKKSGATFYLSEGTLDSIDMEEGFQVVKAGESFKVGDILVKAFNLSHDAKEPIGYSLSDQDGKIVVVTDTGIVTDEIADEVSTADLLVIEANHEVNILRLGDYPYQVKRRILGEYGHLSNEASGKCILDFVKAKEGKVPKVVLAHLSSKNNTPIQAYLTIRNILEEGEIFVGKDLEMDVIVKDQISPRFEV
ncbi:MAG: MBL fold metallo-hydrolase [Clostridia bacterium]|nr:MBL fold metallo-hydrolase [Clostridia bacterium]